MPNERVFKMKFAEIYNLYRAKILRKNREEKDLRAAILQFSRFSESEFDEILKSEISLEDFFARAKLGENAEKISGKICGVEIAKIENPLMKNIRRMDKIVDEIARGKTVEKIFS